MKLRKVKKYIGRNLDYENINKRWYLIVIDKNKFYMISKYINLLYIRNSVR